MTTRILILIAVLAALCGCASRQFVQTPTEIEPLIVRLDEIDREYDDFRIWSEEDGPAIVAVTFKSSGHEDLHSLIVQGVALRCPVYIVDGTTLLARATLAGVSSGRSINGESQYGLCLRFNSIAQAQQASDLLQEDPLERLDRWMDDPRSWIIGTSAAGE